MTSERPNLSDISYSAEMLSVCNYEVRFLDDISFRALLNLVVMSANSRVHTMTDPDPLGRLPDDDASLARVAGMSKRQWRFMRPKISHFFKIGGGYWVLDRDWIRIGKGSSKRPSIPASLRSAVMQRDKFTCGYCGTRSGPFHCDHIIPVKDGGATDFENLICACATCNMDKRATDADEWISAKGTNIISIAAARNRANG